MDILNGYFLKKNDTSIWNVYLSDSRKKRIIQNNPARFLLFLLDATSMSGSPPSFSDYLYFYSFMNRKIHAHFYKPQNKMFHFCKTFCSKITLVNTIQNVILNPI